MRAVDRHGRSRAGGWMTALPSFVAPDIFMWHITRSEGLTGQYCKNQGTAHRPLWCRPSLVQRQGASNGAYGTHEPPRSTARSRSVALVLLS